ncbi:MAG: ABC transporter ATP-binding protein/permease, partial [Actinobacteria bacterium]|nr:ABC transporter ATP-binding protein/permease [Actinomycetota bacterium]
MAPLLERVLDQEPVHPEPVVAFDQSRYDRRPLTLWRLVAPFKWGVVGALLLVVVESVALRLGPTLLQLGIDNGMGLGDLGQSAVRGSRRYLVGVAAAYIALVVVSTVVGYARTLSTGVIAERALYGLRVRVFSHLQRLSLDFFTGERAGRVMTRMTSDIDNLQQLLQEGLVQLLVQLLMLVVLGVQLVLFSPRLALVTLLLVVPAMAVLSLWFQRRSKRGYGLVRERLASVVSDLSESVAGARVVTAHNRQGHNVVRHTDMVGDYRTANTQTAALVSVYGPGVDLLGNITTVVILLVGGRLVLAGDLQVGELAGFLLAMAGFFAPMQQLTQLYNTYQQGQAGLVKLRELLAVEPTVAEAPDARTLGEVAGRITLDGVTFGYDPARPVLCDVSLDVPAGSTLALVGATGSGKSTVAKLIARYYDPLDGRVLVDGQDVRQVTLESLRRRLGLVPQEPFLFDGTLAENIAFGAPDADEDDIVAAALAVGLGDLIARLPEGLGTRLQERGSSLSSGERQLVALARAFLHRPQVLILDEATSSLDLKSEAQVERALDVVLEGRTGVIIAHRLSTAMRADAIAVLDGGRVVELGNHEALLAAGGRYAAMHARSVQPHEPV